MSSFLQENQDFVLKLKIKGADGQTQIRRVRLPRIADSSGSISYEELVGLVVVFTFPEASEGSSGYNVSLTYYDVDGDSVTIASSEELLDACEQYVGQKVLRITTFVKPATTPAPTAVPSAKPEDKKPAPSVDHGTVDHGTVDHGTSTTPPSASPPQPIQIQDVLESFVGVLATAVNHLQEGLAAPSPKTPSRTVAAAARSNAEEAAAAARSNVEPATAAKKPEEVSNEDATQDSKPAAEDGTEPSAESAPEEEEKPEPRPFLHGRHTCDSCLSTPIYGTRYHASNLPDYDLCENCFLNYKGTEIVLEPQELDRDRLAQDRWHRRWAASGREAPQIGRGRRGRFGKPIGPRGRRGLAGMRTARAGQFSCGHPAPPPPHHVPGPPPPPPPGHCPPPPPPPGHCPPHPFGPPPHMGPGGFHGHHHWAHIGPHVAPHVHPPANGLANEFDNALKEAIRRSLSEIAPKEAKIEKAAKEMPEPSAPVEEHTAVVETEATEECNLIELASAKEEETAKTETGDIEDQVGETNGIPRSVEIVNNEEDRSEETAAMEKSMDETESVDSEKLAAEVEDAPSTPCSVPSKPSSSSCNVSDVSKEESFASDAKGNGDVAEAMGAALDAVVDVIREMQDDGNPSAESGELIVDQDAESKDDEEWSVVKSVGSNGTTESKQIAKAAEMLGSALFNSEMKNSTEAEGNGTGSVAGSSFSIPSSVPTDIGTHHAAPAQVDRWGAHLLQLRELGFEDEDECVEVLERLEAANIGVDADDDISINHVVNELLEKQK